MLSREDILENNRKAIADAIAQMDDPSYDNIAATLPALIAKGLLVLDVSAFAPNAPDTRCAARYQLYDNKASNPKDAVSVWAFALSLWETATPEGEKRIRGQATSVHDHLFPCTVTALTPVTEKHFIAETDTQARCVRRTDRHRFHTNQDTLEDPGTDKNPVVHQVKHRKGLGDSTSVTLHIYNMPAQRIVNGETEDNRNLFRIFEKIRTPEGKKDKRPPYEALYVEDSTPRLSI